MTVSELNNYISGRITSDAQLKDVIVSGEISEAKLHPTALYFSLKDDASQIKCVMWPNKVSKLIFEPKNGMKVFARGYVNVYIKGGVYQLYAEDIQPDGIGAEALALQQLKEQLAKEGLFDPAHKKPLPYMPAKIGVVTAKGGAALQDIINVISRRFPMTELILFDCPVQGKANAPKVVEALLKADAYGADVIICGRGGGSKEDLSIFDDEQIARTVYAMKTPVISAVGHEIDTTLIDYVSDQRAATPSAAAEIAVPSKEELYEDIKTHLAKINDVFSAILDRKRHQYVDRASAQLDSAIKNYLERKRMMYEERDRTLKSLYPTHHFDQVGKDLTICREQLNKAMEGFIGARIRYADDMRKALDHCLDNVIHADGAKLAEAAGKLEGLSPLKTLQRGYSIVYLGDKAVRSSSELTLGDRLDIKFADGQATVRVEEIE